MSRQIDGGIHLALACLYTVYRSWGEYPHEIAHIMQEILDLEKRHYAEVSELPEPYQEVTE